ncbi:unnamed protein product [Euphydryas editha]|uniref:Uncharacterized protein n=1 Tax=Euphydryas editha TaxID=104508 RepID=A0AAU9TW28_EUPED|nr:unnamed protein product [Euphydryas editha]
MGRKQHVVNFRIIRCYFSLNLYTTLKRSENVAGRGHSSIYSDSGWIRKALEWRPRTGKRSVARRPVRDMEGQLENSRWKPLDERCFETVVGG